MPMYGCAIRRLIAVRAAELFVSFNCEGLIGTVFIFDADAEGNNRAICSILTYNINKTIMIGCGKHKIPPFCIYLQDYNKCITKYKNEQVFAFGKERNIDVSMEKN